VARGLLARLQELLALNWRQKAAARSALRLAIEDMLDTGLPPAYTPTLFEQKCTALFEHLFERYPEWGTRVYAQAA
jgi:type I restriction enzyme R subunit